MITAGRPALKKARQWANTLQERAGCLPHRRGARPSLYGHHGLTVYGLAPPPPSPLSPSVKRCKRDNTPQRRRRLPITCLMGRGKGPDYHAPPLIGNREGGRKIAQANKLHCENKIYMSMHDDACSNYILRSPSLRKALPSCQTQLLTQCCNTCCVRLREGFADIEEGNGMWRVR